MIDTITVRSVAENWDDADALVIMARKGVRRFGPEVDRLDVALDGVLTKMAERDEISGAVGEITTIYTLGKMQARSVVVVGVGAVENVTAESVRQAAGAVGRLLRQAKAGSCAWLLPTLLDGSTLVRAIVEGLELGLYRFDAYRRPNGLPDQRLPHTCLLLTDDIAQHAPMMAAVHAARAVARGVNFARTLANEPPHVLTPTALAQRCAEMSVTYSLDCELLLPQQMHDLGMGALLGVARGSVEEPRMIVLRYVPQHGMPADKPHVGLIGKGITFDTGGISLKPAADMHQMKCDMAGAAAVAGAMLAIAEQGLPIAVTAVIATAENMPSGTAMVPGDVLRAMDGTTIEVQNTDAEGRLVLADAVLYARRLGLGPLVDVATLTGAAVVALGPFYSALFASDDTLAAQVLRAARDAGERLWQLPLDDDYNDLLKSDCADLRNVGGRDGGAIIGATFIQRFVTSPYALASDGTPAAVPAWAHLDIAALDYSTKEEGYQVKGGTGVATRTLIRFVQMLAEV